MSIRNAVAVLLGIAGCIFSRAAEAAETQRLGIPAGRYEVPSKGRLRISGYCMDYNLLAPAPGRVMHLVGSDDGTTVTRYGASPISLGKALATRVLRVEAHEQSLNDMLDSLRSVRGTPETSLSIVNVPEPGANSEIGVLREQYGDFPASEALQHFQPLRGRNGVQVARPANAIDIPIANSPFINARGEGFGFIRVQPDPRQGDGAGVTLFNNSAEPLTVELESPVVFSEQIRRGTENIDVSQIQPAPDFAGRQRIRHRVWENNETLAAAHCANLDQYRSRFQQQPRHKSSIVKGLIKHGRDSLVLVQTEEGPEVRRVHANVQETIAKSAVAINQLSPAIRRK